MKKIAIVGGSSSAKFAPFDDQSWDIWALGNQMQRYDGKRISRIFEIHDDISEHDEQYPYWLLDFNLPMIVGDVFYNRYAKLAKSRIEAFDYAEAGKYIGENFSSSPAVMMAQAIMDGATEIGIWGVDMALDEHEYYMQRPSMEQWIGFAKGRGVKVFIHDQSPLGYSTYREGRDWPSKGFSGYDKSEFLEMSAIHDCKMQEIEKELLTLNKVEFKINELRAKYQAHDGARQVYNRLAKLGRAKKCGLNVDLRAIDG